MRERIIQRGQGSGRADDHAAAAKTRIDVYHKQSAGQVSYRACFLTQTTNVSMSAGFRSHRVSPHFCRVELFSSTQKGSSFSRALEDFYRNDEHRQVHAPVVAVFAVSFGVFRRM